MRRNKAQASVFIIIGTILLIAAGIYFYARQQTLKQISPEIEIFLEEVPSEFEPVRSFVTSCLEDTSAEGLSLIGKQGGYAGFNSDYSGQSFSLSNDPTDTDAVEFAPNSGLRIPYWHYLSSPNDCENCKFESKRPELRQGENSIQSQLSKYVENNIDRCLDNFNALKEQGFDIAATEKNVEATITENDVAVVLNYDLNVQKENAKAAMTKFFVVLPVSLQKIYNLATAITNMQAEHRFLEKAAINLVSSFAGVDKEKLPPLTDMRFQFGSSTNWIKSDVKTKVTQVLLSYVPLFQVHSTRNYDRNVFDSELRQSLYDDFIVPLQGESYPNLEASFSYLDFWPIYFDLNCNGEFCEPESASSDLLSLVGIQRYNFVYDVSFPAYVEIKEPDALDGRGFNFNFFLEANLRNNEPLPVNVAPLQAAALSFGSQLCDLGNRNSADVEINIRDEGANLPLEDVQVTYTVTDETCFIGATNSKGKLTAKFPTGAIGGVAHFIREDYLKKAVPFDAGLEKKAIEIQLEPVKTKKIIVDKKKLVKTANGWEFQNTPFHLSLKEEAVITLKRNSPLQDEEYTTAASYSLNQPAEIRIAPGSYEATITLFLKDRLAIPERKVRARSGLFEKKEYTIPGIEFNEQSPFPSGGLKLNVTLNPADIERYDTIVFYAVSPALQDIPESERVIEDLQETSKAEYYSKVYQLALQPAFE